MLIILLKPFPLVFSACSGARKDDTDNCGSTWKNWAKRHHQQRLGWPWELWVLAIISILELVPTCRLTFYSWFLFITSGRTQRLHILIGQLPSRLALFTMQGCGKAQFFMTSVRLWFPVLHKSEFLVYLIDWRFLHVHVLPIAWPSCFNLDLESYLSNAHCIYWPSLIWRVLHM